MVRRKSPIKEESIEATAKRTQELYLAKQYERLLPHAERLRQMAQAPAYNAIVLTSYIWSVKAMKTLHHPKLAQTIDAYIGAAKERHHTQHLMQAAQFKLEHALDHHDYERAIDALEATLLALGEGTQTLPLLYQIAEIEIACTHFEAAKRRLETILSSEHAPASLCTMAYRLLYVMSDVTGDNEHAQRYLDRYFASLDTCADDTEEIAEATLIRADIMAREGKLYEAKKIRMDLAKQYEALPQNHEKRLSNDIQIGELTYYNGQAQQALQRIKALSDRIITDDPNQISHISRTLALSRCMLSLDVVHDILSPDLCKTRLKAVAVPALPIEAVSEKLFDIQNRLLHEDLENLDEQIEDLQHRCRFANLLVCIPPLDAIFAEYFAKCHDVEKAKHYAKKAQAGFEHRHDEVSEARVQARLLRLEPQNTSLEQVLIQKAHIFLERGHSEIALTLYLAIAQAEIERGDDTHAQKMLECALPLIQTGYMKPKEDKYKMLCEKIARHAT